MKKRGKLNSKVIPLLIGFTLIIIAIFLIEPNLTGNVISPTTLSDNVIKLSLTIKEGAIALPLIYGNGTSFIGIGEKTNQILITSTENEVILNETLNSYFIASFKLNSTIESYAFEIDQINDENGKNQTILKNLVSGGTDLTFSQVGDNKDKGNINFKLVYANDNEKLAKINISSGTPSGTVYLNRIFETNGDYIILPAKSEFPKTSQEIAIQNSSDVIITRYNAYWSNNITVLNQTYTSIVDSSNCTSNWTALTTNCSTDESGLTYYNDLNNCPNSTRPANITTYCDYDHNGVIGSFTSYDDHNFDLVLLIDGAAPNSSLVYNTTRTIEFKEGNITRIKFSYSFASPLNLKAMSLKKQPSSFDYGYMIVQGINASKTLTVDKLSSTGNQICAVNKEISDIEDISTDCDETDEYIISCPGNNSFITCNISEGKFIVSGLTNSAVKEINGANIGLSCTPNWTCNSWSACASGQQTRTCTDSNNCNSIQNKPAESQACACTANWTCSAWTPTVCPNNRTQTRTCTDSNNCNSIQGKLPEKQNCVYKATISLKVILLVVAVILTLLAVVTIVYFIIKNLNQAKSKNENIIISKPQIPPAQMPMNPYPIQRPLLVQREDLIQQPQNPPLQPPQTPPEPPATAEEQQVQEPAENPSQDNKDTSPASQ